MKSVLAAAFALALVSPALAGQCPGLMTEVDEKMEMAQLSEEQRAEVMELRQEGEQLHEAGNHAESEAALNQALEILDQ